MAAQTSPHADIGSQPAASLAGHGVMCIAY